MTSRYKPVPAVLQTPTCSYTGPPSFQTRAKANLQRVLQVTPPASAPGTSPLVPPLQAQADTYSGYLVSPAAEALHPLVCQDVSMKALPAFLPGTFTLISTSRTGVNNLFFRLATCLFYFLQSPGWQLARCFSTNTFC